MGVEFATTQWSEVLAARDGSTTEAQSALEALCEAYWFPLYAHIRRSGCDPEEARDLTQGYFAELLDKGFLEGVDPQKGRFRSFLRASLRHYLSHERDKARALKRGGGSPAISLDAGDAERRYGLEPTDELTPEEVFEHRWALTVLDRALERLRGESEAAGSGDRFERLRPYLTESAPLEPYRVVASELGQSEEAIRAAVHRLRQRYGDCLRAEIAETVADPAEIDDEVRHLLSAVHGS